MYIMSMHMRYFLLVSCLLISCTTTPKPIIVTKVETIKQKIPIVFLEECTIPSPPDKDIYINSVSVDREWILTKYIYTLINTLANCNNKIKEIQRWNDG